MCAGGGDGECGGEALIVLVRQWCEENKITYRHFATLADNVGSTCRYLHQLGQPDKMHTG